MIDPKAWSPHILLRYALLQVPGIILIALLLVVAHTWLSLSPPLAAAFLALWIGKDIILYPFVWRAYDNRQQQSGILTLKGQIGIAEEPLVPAGFVRIQGVLWQAILTDPRIQIQKGQKVRVVGGTRLTVFVEPLESGSQ
ncbi:MAG TPA: NfeD family protein [Thermodesulfobacteriota bacterium]|nr:NfeD family protein [Deltaproteobacteria bacterium]HNR12324.1 NfeD family protein [Thermodesulfobacteriota bacterium]HNU71291.1 NfeD family protein [Thermodesulfobacteriota bacterium]HOC39130.1 NfeD family protein [Thermodesulfobacteriota bacterium]HQO77687.1 NfeD family protein [Thermodesulfobacteriota bacterium]